MEKYCYFIGGISANKHIEMDWNESIKSDEYILVDGMLFAR